MKSTQVACRLPPELGEKIDEAEVERGVFRSEILRAAIRHYIRTNPDEYAAFREEAESRSQPTHSGDKSKGSSEDRSLGVYDPTRDGSK